MISIEGYFIIDNTTKNLGMSKIQDLFTFTNAEQSKFDLT